MIYITGDIHGSIDIHKLNMKNFPAQKNMTKNDYLIILGDFGLYWNNTTFKSDMYWLNWLKSKNFTTLFIDGNHENHHKLFSGLLASEMVGTNIGLPNYIIEKRFGGYVGKLTDSIYHLRRGEVYTIQEKKFFVMGGAYSIDKLQRIKDFSWWSEEEPNYKEFNYGLDNLKKNNNEVDYILGHTGPESIIQKIINDNYKNDSVTKYFDHIISYVKFNKFYCGHFHEDKIYDRYNFLYNKIENLVK